MANYSDYRPGGFNILPPVTKNLLIINGLVFLGSLIPDISKYIMFYFPLWYPLWPLQDEAFFAGSGVPFLLQKIPYQFITHMFTHYEIGHILFNMLCLWMFGSVIENYWKASKFLAYYLICGVGAGVIYIAWLYINHTPGVLPMVGASGALYGILLAYAFMFPNNHVYIYFLIPIKAKYLMTGLILMNLVLEFSNRPGDNVAHLAHVGGALTGLLVLLYWRKKGRLYWKNF